MYNNVSMFNKYYILQIAKRVDLKCSQLSHRGNGNYEVVRNVNILDYGGDFTLYTYTKSSDCTP